MSELRSYGSPRFEASSSAASIGFANASPTIVSWVTRWSWTARHSSSPSKERDGRVTTQPPAESTASDVIADVPCINGAAGSSRTALPRSWKVRAAATTCSAVDGTDALTTANVAAVVPSRLRCGHITPLGMPVVPPV